MIIHGRRYTFLIEPFKVLICGGGIAGPALAFWLSRLGYDITIVERFSHLRVSGLQIDLRGQGVQVMKTMGIEQAVRAKVVDEAGVQFFDSSGKRKAFFEANKSGKGKQSATSEFEIMRGDLCRILYDLTKDRVKYVFGVQVIRFEQDESSIRVQFSDGMEGQFDLLVGADGQNSRTRRMMLGPDVPDPFHFLGLHCCYFTIPQQEGDTNIATIYHIPDKRVIATRRDNPRTLQAYLAILLDLDRLKGALKKDVIEQKRVWADLFHDVGWQGTRITDAMLNEPTADDFYSHRIGQVKMDSWSRGRVVLLGDAGYCPSPLSGMGTSSALVGAYVLAGEIAKHCNPSNSNGADDAKDRLFAALEAYHHRFSPFVNKVQKLLPGHPAIGFPRTKWGIFVLHSVLGLASALRLDKLVSVLMSDNVRGWELPEYSEL